jgi:LDH2 family malate/lactate/ureidoglycolate dehydrogenase
MSSTAGSGPLLDADSPETVRLTPEQATAIGIKALGRIGYEPADAKIIVDQLVDNSLCGYRFAGLPRIMAIAGDEKARHGRKPITTVRETPVSALLDGGNEIGYIVAYRAAEVAIAKARTSGIACVGAYNSYYSGRNAYFVEKVAREGLVAIHIASAKPRVLPVGGARPALGTNPLCFGFPSKEGPVIFDMGTAALMWGDVLLHAHLGQPLPEGIGFDADGRATTDARETLKGGVVPFGGHKGYGLALIVGLLAGTLGGAAMGRDVVDFNADHVSVTNTGQAILVIDLAAFGDPQDFKHAVDKLVRDLRGAERLPGVERIWLPGEQSHQRRQQYAATGIPLSAGVVADLTTLAVELGIAPLV